MKRSVLSLFLILIAFVSGAQVTWDGGGDGVSWNDPNNWTGNFVPVATDPVVLDNSIVSNAYTVNLPAGAVTVTLVSLRITPAGLNMITLNLPSTNTAAPGLAITGPGDALILDNNAVLRNSSGAASGSTLDISSMFRINNGGHYIHNTARSNAAIVAQLSTAAGTESGEFEFDVPVASYTPSLSGRNYGNLTFKAVANGGSATYIGGGATACTIRGNLSINTGVIFSVSMSASLVIQKDLVQFSSSTFNLQSSTNNNTVRIAGNILHDGIITESNTGLPRLELNGNLPQIISGNGPLQNAVTLVINNPAGATLQSALALPYNLTLTAGRLTTSSTNLLVLLDNATVTGSSASSFVNGPMKKTGDDPFVFPVGKGGILAPIAITGGTGASLTDEFTAEYMRSNPQGLYGGCPAFCAPGLDHTSSVEYWTLERNAGTATKQVSLTVHSLSFCKSLVNTFVSRRAITEWTQESTTINAGPMACGTMLECGSIMTTGVLAAFGVFTLATDLPPAANPLPIRLARFTARKQSDHVALIQWELGQPPAKGDSFEIQKSGDGLIFNNCLILPAEETMHAYQVNDTRLAKGKTWYRLKMTDADGTVTYSKTVVVVNETKGLMITSVMPNPANQFISISLITAKAGTIIVEIYDLTGRKVKNLDAGVTEGNNNITISLTGLPAGVFQVMVIDNETRALSRFVKQ